MLPCSNRHTIVGNCLQSSQNSCAGLILPPTFQQLTSDRMLSRGGFKVRHGLCSANGCLSASAAGGSMAQSGSNVLVTCRSSVRRGRTAASPFCQLEVPTRSCRWVLRKAVVQRLNSADQPAKLAQVRCNEGLSCITAEGLAYLADTSRSSPIRERRESVSLDFVWHAWLVRIGALAPLRALKRGLRAPF